MFSEKLVENSNENQGYGERLEAWTKMEEYFGRPDADDSSNFDDLDESENSFGIEEKIKELVVGLNLIGLRTHYSCEGHYDGVRKFSTRRDEGGDDEEEKIKNPSLESHWRHPYADFEPDSYSYENMGEKMRKAITAVQELIDEFYKDCEVLPEIRVQIKKKRTKYSDYEITSSDVNDTKTIPGSDYQKLERVAVARVKDERREIIKFGEFIKKKYLETGLHL
jgi:hypothetical protein